MQIYLLLIFTLITAMNTTQSLVINQPVSQSKLKQKIPSLLSSEKSQSQQFITNDIKSKEQEIPAAECTCFHDAKCKNEKCQCLQGFFGNQCELTGVKLSQKMSVGDIYEGKQYFYIVFETAGFYFITLNMCIQSINAKNDATTNTSTNTKINIFSQSNITSGKVSVAQQKPQGLRLSQWQIPINKNGFSCHKVQEVLQVEADKEKKIIFIFEGILSNNNTIKNKMAPIAKYSIILALVGVSELDVYFQLFMLVGWSCLLLVFTITLVMVRQMCRRRVPIHQQPQESIEHFSNLMPNIPFKKGSTVLECSVCLLEFQENDDVRNTPCKHTFHKECIDYWCVTKLSCPICRSELTSNAFYRLAEE